MPNDQLELKAVIFEVSWVSALGCTSRYFRREDDAWELYREKMASKDPGAVMLKVHTLEVQGSDALDVAMKLLNRERFIGHTENLANVKGPLHELPAWAFQGDEPIPMPAVYEFTPALPDDSGTEYTLYLDGYTDLVKATKTLRESRSFRDVPMTQVIDHLKNPSDVVLDSFFDQTTATHEGEKAEARKSELEALGLKVRIERERV